MIIYFPKSVHIYQQYLLLFLYIERAKIDGGKSATKKPWLSDEMSAIQSHFKMNIKSHVVLGKSSGRCAKFFSSVAKANLNFD